MRKTNLWKVRRELKRPFRQSLQLLSRLGSYFFAARYYDWFLARAIRRTSGLVPFSEKIAIYLIYPSYGLKRSHLDSLEYIRSKGYAPLVVSNVALAAADREQLLPLCHICIERPNYGYDFGGYRDGVLTMANVMPSLVRLLLINDSTWFPLPGCSDWLEEGEAMGTDLVAAASSYGFPRVDPKNYRGIKWDYATTHRDFHFCSYALLFSANILEDPDFMRFWQKFPLTNSKEQTVRRGEIGLSRWVLSRGFSYGVPCGMSALHEELAALDDVRLREVAENLILHEDRLMLEAKHEVLAGNPNRQDLICLILTGVARQGSSYALADYAINERGFPFLKKSPAWSSKEASDITLRLAETLPGRRGATIRAEAEELRDSKSDL